MELITLIFLTSFYNFENFYNEMDIFIKGEIIKKKMGVLNRPRNHHWNWVIIYVA